MKSLIVVLALISSATIGANADQKNNTTKKKTAAKVATTAAKQDTEADFNANPGKSRPMLVSRHATQLSPNHEYKSNYALRGVASVPSSKSNTKGTKQDQSK